MNDSIPLWTEKTGKQGGRDHLGLQSVGQSMLEELTSGISNITKRLRYFSLYCWIIDSFATSSGEKTKKSYRKYLNDMSLLYTLSSSYAHKDDSSTGIDGIDFARKWLEKIISGERIIDDTIYSSKEYRNNNWIYKAKLNDLLLTVGEIGTTGIPQLNDPGKKLADAFGKSIKDIHLDAFSLNDLHKDLFSKLEHRWCYHRLNDNQEEQKILEDILFARIFSDQKKQKNRRYSLILMLHYMQKHGTFQKKEYEQWIYNETIALPQQLLQIKRLWKILFARNYLVYSFESLFLSFLNTIRDRQQSLEDYINEISLHVGEDDYLGHILKDNLNVKVADFYVHVYGNAIPEASSKLYESALILELDNQTNRFTPDVIRKFYINSVFCLFSLYSRYKKYAVSDDEEKFIHMGDSFRFSLKHLFDTIDVAIQTHISLKDFIFELYNTNILPRHLSFAYNKYWNRSLDTFHFQYEDGIYSYVNRKETFAPKYNFMKFDEIINFFEDLDIIEKNDKNEVSLTHSGNNLIDEFYE